MPPTRRIRKRTTRAEEAAEQAAVAAATRDESAGETKSEKKTKKSKKKRETSAEPKVTVPTKEEREEAALSAILPRSLEDDPSSLLTYLLVEIQSLASSKKRCTDALRALKDGRGLATPHTNEDAEGDKKDEETSPPAGRGTKRTRAADKKKKKGGGPLSFEVDGEDFNSQENAQRIRDTHLIMATTQAINVLIAYLKKCKEDNEEENVKQVCLVMAALSHHLITSLVNDKSLLESITKSSQYTGLHQSMQSSLGTTSPFASTWGRIHDEDAIMEDSPTSLRGRKKEAETSESMQEKLERKNKITASYAKAVAGRAMTSCVVGAMDAMEALGELKSEDGTLDDVVEENQDDQKTEYTLLRRGVWTCLLALETAFQLNNKPKLLMTSSMSVSTMPSSTGISSYPGEMDFDGMMSAVMGSLPGAGGSGSNVTTWVHTHNMMGSSTIAMWNGLVQQIMLDYKLGFNLQHESSDQRSEAENQSLSFICREITDKAFLDENDSKFISLVLNKPVDIVASSSNEPPLKKTKRTTKAKKPVKRQQVGYELSELSSLLAQRQENFILFDCHVSVRRWSTLAFGWLCSGQPRFLETCMNILTQKEWWKKVLEMPQADSTIVASHILKPSTSKKKAKDLSHDAISSPRNKQGGIRGDLALVVFTSCIVDLISAGGISPSNSGWIDEYIKTITNAPDADLSFAAPMKGTNSDKNDDHPVRRSARARTRDITAKANASAKRALESTAMSPKGGKKSVTSWVRPNVTEEVAFLTKLLIEAHSACLQDSFRDHLLEYTSSITPKNANVDLQMRKLLVNDDDSYRDSLSYRRSESKILVNSISYYPFMHRTLETLGRIAAASAFIPSSSRKSRIQAIGGALVLSHFAKYYRKVKDGDDSVVVLDAKLVSLAVAQLSDAFNIIVKKNNVTEAVDKSDDSSGDETAVRFFLAKYRLNEPLGINREKSKKEESELDPRVIEKTISYGGAFNPGSNETATVEIEILSSFIRAQIDRTSNKDAHISGMGFFIKSLLFIVDMCYEFPSERQTSALSDTKRKKRKAQEVLSGTSQQQTMTRCVLAADTLNFLRACMTQRDNVAITRESACMTSFLKRKEVVTADVVNLFVDCGYALQEKLVYARVQRMGERTSFTPEERRVWSAHVKMSLTFGRGQTTFLPNNVEVAESLLNENGKRIEIFQHIARLEHKRHYKQTRSPGYHWPLFLPTLQHALVGSALSCISTKPESAIEPELFLCNNFLGSLEREFFPPKDQSSTAPTDETPLSFRDARLFILAATKLKKHQQREAFVRLIELLTVVSEKSGHDEKAIQLHARGVCLAAHMADIVTSTGLGITLSREVASEHYNLPKFLGKTAANRNKEAMFMGLFGDCNSPSVPSSDVSSFAMMLSDSEFEKIFELVKSSIKLGFEVSVMDRCHLLFSAWNASSKLSSWTPICWEGPSTASAIKKQDFIDRLINLRDDMCEVWCLFNKSRVSSQQQTLLEKSTSSKTGRCRPREALISGITSSEQMIRHVTSELLASDNSKPDAVPIPTFAYIEALPVYLSFLICMHTKPGPNNFSSLHRFSRSHAHVETNTTSSNYTEDDVLDEFQSDGSDPETSEIGEQSLRTRALERLHNVCMSLGAAPCWPDWLDSSCRMHADIVPSIAVDSADGSLSSLTQLGAAVFDSYCKTLQNALDIACCGTSDKSPRISASLLHLLLASQQHSSLGSGNESFYSYLSTISQTSAELLKSVANGKDSLPSIRFTVHSAQRIQGADVSAIKDPTTAELRANEQWETILSEVIRGSSLQNASVSFENPELRRALEVTSHWKRVLCSVVNAMVPTSALLRFGLYDAKGRNPHPLCNDLPESALSSETAVSSHFSSRNEVGANIKKALAFLSRVCAFSVVDDSDLRSTAQAAANHIIESNAQSHFNSMVMLQAIQIRLSAIQGLFDSINEKSISAAAFIVIKNILNQISIPHCSSALLARFGLKGVLQTELIGDKTKVELMDILSSEWNVEQVAEIPKLLFLMLADKQQHPSPHNVKLTIADTLCRLIDTETELLAEKGVKSTGTFRCAAATALNGMMKDEVCLLMRIIYPLSASYDPEIAQHLVKLLISLATTKPNATAGNGYESILEDMTENVGQWAPSPMLTNLICTLASRFSTLHSLMDRVFALAANTESSQLNKCIQSIFQFAVSLQNAGNHGSVLKSSTESKNRGRRPLNQPVKRRTCTFTQTGEGFAEQHWYNCYTCGLLWDKGCCSLCARVCHKDHDVGYSRKSSFFCDCGAEVASGVKPKCKCLDPIDDTTFRALNDESNSAEELNRQESSNPAELIRLNYPTECMRTLQLFTKAAKTSAWNDMLIELFNKSFSIYAGVDFLTLMEDPPHVSVSNTVKPTLDLRCGVPLNLEVLNVGPSMLPIRAAKANSIKVGMMSSSSPIYMRKNRGGRQLIDSDARGRMVCAESNSLSFFSVIPPINTKTIGIPHSSHLSRSELSCLGTEKIAFEVHGVALSSNQNLLAIWGASNACIVVLSKGFDTIERIVTLDLQFESDSNECESEHLLSCLWLTETFIVCICGTVIHVFDLKATHNDDSCRATSHFVLAYEDVLIRSAVLTQDFSTSHSNEVHKKLVILLDSGRLYFIDLHVDSDGVLEEEGETYIEVGSGTSFPSAGIRRYYGGEPSSVGSTSTTLGEGSSLHFLRQSNLLLYQCVSSPVVAMLIDKNGTISGTFELLPSTISSDNLPCGELGVVAGPYLHFQELGIVCKKGEVFYRVSCVARVPSSTQHKILLLEFNQSSCGSVKELVWPPSFSAGLGSFSSYSFVGSCTFSAPCLIKDNSLQGFTSSGSEVYERAFLTMLSSNGSLLWFGEEVDRVATEKSGTYEIDLNTNLYMFEDPSIINVSEDDRTVFGGDCIGKDSKTAKKKLSLNNNEFLSSHSRDGCTVTARLETSRKGKYDSKERTADDLAIVAVRVLVGSMPDLIPREISVMGSGRTIKTKRNMKRWYEYVLTEEEILLTIRNGLITINVSSSHDLTSGAVVDAIEIYAKARSDLPFLKQENNSTLQDVYLKWRTINEREGDHVLCINSLQAMTKFLCESKVSTFRSGIRDIIGQVLEKTALESCEQKQSLRNSTLSLLDQIEENETERSHFINRSTIKGLMTTLIGLESFIKSQTSVVGAPRAPQRRDYMLQRALEMLVHMMRISADIAQSNGKYYIDTITKLSDSKSETSIAIHAKRIIDYVTHVSLLHGCSLSFATATYFLSRLILAEMMCRDSKKFPPFDTLSEYLLNDDASVIESCCKAITSTFIDAPKSNKYIEERTQDNPNGYVTYQCDACKKFPIKDIRYTIGGEVDIDLCRDCFERGCSYAATQPHDAPLVIHGRTLRVEDEDMPCVSIHEMKEIVIAAPSAGFPEVEDVEAALKLSQTTRAHASSGDGIDREAIKSRLFSHLLSLVPRSITKTLPLTHHLIHLLLKIVYTSKSEKLKSARGKEMLNSMAIYLRDMLQAKENGTHAIGKMVVVLRTLSSLVTKKTSIVQGIPISFCKNGPREKDFKRHQHKSKTDPRFICDVHKIPAVRRRCSHGIHKDRRFYVCGLGRKHRCSYFKWADASLNENPDQQQDIVEEYPMDIDDVLSQTIFEPIKVELTKLLDDEDHAPSIQSQFCSLIGDTFEEMKDCPESDAKEVGITERPTFLTMAEDAEEQDAKDGVVNSKIKLGKIENAPTVHTSKALLENLDRTTSLIYESLYLFSFVASPSQKWGPDWHPVLCAIISGASPSLCHLAKKLLKKLCGDNQDLYHRVRDHYVYGFQFRKLLRQSEVVMDQALIVREMAKQCGDHWREDEVEFKTLKSASLIGVGDLISEDCLSVTYERKVQQILDELLSTAGTHARKRNWRNFCALPEIPANSNRDELASNESIVLEHLGRRPAIMSLLWLSSCLRHSNQVKLLQLVDIALTDIDKDEMPNNIGDDGVKTNGRLMNEFHQISHQKLVLFDVGDLHSFIVEFIVKGRSRELRSHAVHVATKFASRLCDADKETLFSRLIDGLLRNVAGNFGRACEEFVELLRLFVQKFCLDLSRIAPCVSSALLSQLTVANNHATKTPSPSDFRFDVGNCAHCQSATMKMSTELSPTKENEVWIDEQLRPCVKSRLESSTLGSTHSEYASYFQLKFRLVLCEVHLTVSDPRGRLVKNIGVYFSPRPVGDVNMLKNDKYVRNWQRCGTLNLTRNATTATLKLNAPVVAASLKFKYEDFYEKTGGASNRAADGSFILHCPRCTRQVNNAHGVCGNCGEVAFQCRKCRHINYDRLDAFLCVECGYCISGSFNYDVTVGMALNAVAITNEGDYERSVSMLQIASKRHTDLRNSLKKKILVAAQQHSKSNGQDEHIEEMVLYGSHLRRALLGRLPKMNDESESKISSFQSNAPSRQGDPGRSLPSNRARSLLSLARSLRNDGASLGGITDRLSRSELLQQVLLSTGNAGISSELLDELNESVFGSADHSLTRAIASMQDRNHQRSSRDVEAALEEDNPRAVIRDEKRSTSPTGECSRIYAQMREAERECYELTRRIEAWNRLNKDALAVTGPKNPFKSPFTFQPTTCSKCSPQVALALMSLLSAIFETSISQSESVVTPELIKLLIVEPASIDIELKNIKRQALVTLASTSDAASRIILEEIKLRLNSVQDVTSAELLGQIVQLDFPSVGEYIDFAVSVLQGNNA